MTERDIGAQELVGPAPAGPLLAALRDTDAEIRVEAFRALVALPLSAEIWRPVADYANAVLRERPAIHLDERRTVVEATPWVPIASVRETVAQLALGKLDADGVLRSVATEVVVGMSIQTAADPGWRAVESTGFTLHAESA